MKTISETIDGSIKNIIQLKTVDNSLEYSQMFDALEDCPDDFKAKLIGALNSLGETMGTDPCDAFNKVLCASDDENAKKKLYNWWRAVFEVISKSSLNVPKDKMKEYEGKLDALVAEICKFGDKESGNGVVLEDYETADLEDEYGLREEMAFAVSKIGGVAKKAEELVNFLNPYCGTDKFNEDNDMKKLNERGGSDWVSMDDIVGMEVGEADDGSQFWRDIDKIDDLEKKGYWSGKFRVGDKVTWIDPETEEITYGWKVVDAPEPASGDGIYVIAKDDGSEAEVYGNELRPANMNESDLENELAAGDDGWKKIGQPVPVKEATVTVDANDVWDVLDLLNDDVANKNLTDLINSHTRSEEEIMDAIENLLGASGYSGDVPRDALNGMFSADNIADVIEELGLDVEAFMTKREFVDPQKPVTLEGSEGDKQKPDELKDGEKKYKQDGETKTLVTGGKKNVVSEMTIEQEINDPWKLVNLLWGQGKENFQELLDSNLFDDDTIMNTLEQFEIRELGNLNDFLAFEFENFLEALGCDRDAWVQNLEIQKA